MVDSPGSGGDVTRLLVELRDGDEAALERLMPLIYDELRVIARRRLAGDRNATIEATALVHEAYVKLAAGPALDWQNRAHFYAIAARAMRQVLVDHARKRRTDKRGGEWVRTTFTEGLGSGELTSDELIALDDALEKLDPRQRAVVEYKFFGGMPEREIAEVLGVSPKSVQRDWIKARAWLYATLYPDDGP
jgi:RNA polymerase sigma factor (TIGR02999 family)